MRRQYDFSRAKKNPYVRQVKRPVTIRLDADALEYFQALAERKGLPYQSLINLYLRDCAARKVDLSIEWKPKRKGVA